MGLVSTLKNIFVKKTLAFADGEEMVRQLGRTDYVTEDIHIEVLPDALLELTEEIDLETVFVCGGYAAFVAGLTKEYGDIDLFCTSKITFDTLANRLQIREDKSPTVVAGHYDGYSINIVHCPAATSPEDIMDGFDMTWCRVGIDLQQPSLIIHPQADSELPIFDEARMEARNMSKNNLVDRLFDRYCKYKERRIKPCPAVDNQVRNVLDEVVHKPPEPTPTQIPQNQFDNSY